MQAVSEPAVNRASADAAADDERFLTAQELLAGSLLSYDIEVPAKVLRPAGEAAELAGQVRVRPLKVATLALIARAAREDSSLVPLLMIKESLLEPPLTLEKIRQMHAGLVDFLIAAINRVSGLESGQSAQNSARSAAASVIGEAHLRLAWHFGWTPAQVAELTPGQVAIYLAGIDRLQAEQLSRASRQ